MEYFKLYICILLILAVLFCCAPSLCQAQIFGIGDCETCCDPENSGDCYENPCYRWYYNCTTEFGETIMVKCYNAQEGGWTWCNARTLVMQCNYYVVHCPTYPNQEDFGWVVKCISYQITDSCRYSCDYITDPNGGPLGLKYYRNCAGQYWWEVTPTPPEP